MGLEYSGVFGGLEYGNLLYSLSVLIIGKFAKNKRAQGESIFLLIFNSIINS
jgi:hypothetical protein